MRAAIRCRWRIERWISGPRRAQCGCLQQENSADLPLGVTSGPEAFLVAADEECRDRLIDDAGIEWLKLRGDGRKLVARVDARVLTFPPDCSGRASRHLSP